jgi:anti-sigma28 factor (negative regulator of flagellin synthesis)
MKIDGQQQSAGTNRAQRGDAPAGSGRTGGAGTSKVAAGTAGTDRVETSPDLRLLAMATSAILDAPAIRPEAVEKGRQLIASGTAGADAGRLADAIITQLLGQ